MPEGSQLCQEAKTRLETDQWSTSGKRGGATAAHAKQTYTHSNTNTP